MTRQPGEWPLTYFGGVFPSRHNNSFFTHAVWCLYNVHSYCDSTSYQFLISFVQITYFGPFGQSYLYKCIFDTLNRWELWRAPVIQLLGSLNWWMVWGRDFLLSSAPCRSGVHAKSGIDMVMREESCISRLSKARRIGPGEKSSRQKSPCRTVVGSHPWMGIRW